MSDLELERIIEQAKKERPIGQLQIAWNPNTGQHQFASSGDLSPAEIVYVLEITKELLMRKFVPQSALVIPGVS